MKITKAKQHSEKKNTGNSWLLTQRNVRLQKKNLDNNDNNNKKSREVYDNENNRRKATKEKYMKFQLFVPSHLKSIIKRT